MNSIRNPIENPRAAARRRALMAGVAGLGAVALLAGAAIAPHTGVPAMSAAAYAQTAARPPASPISCRR